jgi:endoplasmic reticulum-Golgi intermediate compartment protein 2
MLFVSFSRIQRRHKALAFPFSKPPDHMSENTSDSSNLNGSVAKTKPSYTSPTRRGGQWTVAILLICSVLSISELLSWFRGTENHHFSVEKGVSHELQMNLDLVVAMRCDDLRINVQDAAGDRILAAELLQQEGTSWKLWTDKVNREIASGVHEYQILNQEDTKRIVAQEEDVHVRHVMGEVRRNVRRKFPRGPRLRRGDTVDSCRIYGSLEGNKVLGDFHITARGHGYQDPGGHLDHRGTSFST